jgi:hypothetical protein
MQIALRLGACALVIALSASLPSTSSVAAQGITREQVSRRHNIRVFENVLVSAAQHGAELLGMRVQQIDPSIVLLTGTSPRAEGFVIDGHGVFLHVEIPAVDPVVAWAVRTRGRDEMVDRSIATLRQGLKAIPDPQMRAILEQQVRRIEQRVTPPGAGLPQAQQMSDTTEAGPKPPLMDDPNLEYERLVTEQLIDAMLDHSHQLGLGPDDSLTIAARGSHGPLLAQAAFDDSVTLMLRAKGSDLAEFRAGRITRDEARARVTVREF